MRYLAAALLLFTLNAHAHHISYVATYCRANGVVTLQKAEAFDSQSGERLGRWTRRTLEHPDIGMEAWMAGQMTDWRTHRGAMYRIMAGRCAAS